MFFWGLPIFRAEALASVNGNITVTEEVLPGISDPLIVGSAVESTTTSFGSSTAGVMQLTPFCQKSGSGIKVSVSSTTSSTTFAFAGASYSLSSLSSSAQSISPLSEAGGCVLALEAWNNGIQKKSFDNDFTIEFDLTAAEYDRFVTGDLALYSFATTSSQWVKITSITRDDNAHTLRVSVNHLSLFSALGTLRTSSSTPQSSVSGSGASGGSSLGFSPSIIPSLIPALVSQVRTAIQKIIPPTPPKNAGVISIPSTVPQSLFDIRAEMTSERYLATEAPEAVVTFDNFGTAPTNINLIFTLFNSLGKEILRSGDQITIETQGVYRKKFSQLPADQYRLVVVTNYSKSINDRFNLHFKVVAQGGIIESVKQYFEKGKYDILIFIFRLVSVLATSAAVMWFLFKK